MSDVLVRGIVVGAVALAAVATGRLATHVRRSSQPHARVDGLGFDGAIVAFTSTACSNCKKAMAVLRELNVPIREVTYDLEPALFDVAEVNAVPLVVVLGRDGSWSAQFGGVVRASRLRRALTRAGW